MLKLDDIKKLRSQKTVVRYIGKHFEGRLEAFLNAVNSSFNDLIRTDLMKAGIFLNGTKNVFKYLPASHKGRLLAMKARYFQFTGKNQEAARKYEEALTVNEKYREYATNARLRKGLMNVYMYLGRYDEALKAGRLALKYFRGKGFDSDAGQVLNNLGNIYHRMDRIPSALQYYEQAGDIFRKTGGVPLAIIEFNKANIYSVLNELNTARRLYGKAEKIYSETGNNIALCQIDYSRAIMDYWEGHYTKAFNVLEKTIDRLSELGDMRTAVIAQLDLVELNIELNLFSNAVYVAENIIRLAGEMGMTYEQAKAHYFIARAAIHHGDYKKAELELSHSERLFTKEKNSLWLAMVNYEKGRLLAAVGDLKQAARLCSRSEKQFKKYEDKYRANEAALFRMEIALLSGKAASTLRLAAALLRKKLPATQKQNLYYLIGRGHFLKEDFKAALPWLKKSVNLIEKNLISMHDDELRFFYIADKYHIYKMIVRCYLNLGRVQTSYLNNLRALSIVNSRSARIAGWQKKIPANLIKERDSLRIALKKIHRVPGEGHRLAASGNGVSALEQKLWSIERKIRSFGNVNEVVMSTGHISPSSLTGFIRKNEAFLDFLILGDKAGVFYMTDRDQKYIELAVSPDELRMDIRKLSFICERSILRTGDNDKTVGDINHILAKISDHIIEPIENLIDSKDLIILLEGEFFQIPFPALRSKSGSYLKEGRNIFLISDPMDLSRRNRRPTPFSSRENSVFSASLNQLSSMDFEAGEIRAIFDKARVYSGSEAGRESLLAEIEKTSGFLHIAAHASRSSENPLFSKILLDDGPFFPFDLYGKNIKPALVTLSGCHTAAPGLYYGDSYSLAKVFYQAGTRYVLGSIWPVSDSVSMFFMISFYKSLHEHNDVFTAYRDAVDATMTVVDNPAFWGAFILLGL